GRSGWSGEGRVVSATATSAPPDPYRNECGGGCGGACCYSGCQDCGGCESEHDDTVTDRRGKVSCIRAMAAIHPHRTCTSPECHVVQFTCVTRLRVGTSTRFTTRRA